MSAESNNEYIQFDHLDGKELKKNNIGDGAHGVSDEKLVGDVVGSLEKNEGIRTEVNNNLNHGNDLKFDVRGTEFTDEVRGKIKALGAKALQHGSRMKLIVDSATDVEAMRREGMLTSNIDVVTDAQVDQGKLKKQEDEADLANAPEIAA